MPLVHSIISDRTLFGLWKITESIDALTELYKTKHYSFSVKFKSERRCAEWLSARLLACELLNDNVCILNDSKGKPFIENSSLCISISHTKGYAAVAISDSPIGVDIELQERSALSASKRFMNTAEQESLNNGDKNSVALLHWSAKEALFKIVGDLGGNFKDNITIHPFELSNNGELMAELHDVDSLCVGIYSVKYAISDRLLVTLCGDTDLSSKELLIYT